MAYRDFRNEKTYAAPEFQGLPQTLSALDTMRRVDAQKRQRQYDLEDNWKTFVATTKIPSLSRKINAESGDVSRSAVNAFRANLDRLPSELIQRKDKLSAQNAEAVAIEEGVKLLNDTIQKRGTQDKYYKPAYDLEQLKGIVQDNDLPIEEQLKQMNAMLNQVNNSIGKDLRNSFDRDAAIADYVNTHGTTEQENDYTSPDGVRSKTMTKARFRNDKGVPEITDQHINELMGKDPRLYQSFQMDAVDKLYNDWTSFKASGKQVPAWAEGLSDNEIVTKLAESTEAQQSIGLKPQTMWQRIASEARPAIKKFEDTSVSSFYDQEKQNPGYQYGFTSDKLNAPVFGFNTGKISGPSVTVTTKSNASPYLTLDSSARARMDPETGKVTYSQSPRKTIVNNVTWGAYTVDKDGNKIPFQISATNEQEYLEKLKSLTPEQRIAIAGFAPIVNGHSIDKAGMINAGYEKQQELQDILDTDPLNEKAKADMASLTQLMEDINAGNNVNGQLVQKFMGVDIMKPEAYVLDPRDANSSDYQSRTGADLHSDKVKTPEIKDFLKKANAIIGDKSTLNQELKIDKDKRFKSNVKKIKGNAPPPSVELKQSYSTGDKTYTLDELRKMGYTDDQLRQAVKDGTIK